MIGGLDPPIAGDPPGMQRLAAELRLEADRAEGVARRVEQSMQELQFEGPAAERLRAESRAWSAQVRGHCSELRALADMLSRSAGQVDAAQRERARRLREHNRAPLRR
jgi:uncharacterized protein YukE